MKSDSRSRAKRGAQITGLAFLLVVVAIGCQKKEEAPPAKPTAPQTQAPKPAPQPPRPAPQPGPKPAVDSEGRVPVAIPVIADETGTPAKPIQPVAPATGKVIA